MTPRQKRFAIIGGALAALGVASALVFYSLRSNMVFFYTPTQVSRHEAPQGRAFRIGGLVQPGSLKREGTQVQFVVTDNVQSLPVSYTGTLPDLFREGKGVVAQGSLQAQGRFVASEVLAKHDENYMPREVIDTLKAQGVYEAPTS